MTKRDLVMPLLVIGMAFLVRCSDEILLSDKIDVIAQAGKGGGGGHVEPAGNNLSFPVFAMDGYAISTVQENLSVIYTGPYDGLDAEELALLEATGPWYAQKVAGNVWQAEFNNSHEPLEVTFIDWGDVIESVNPVVGRPFRLETAMYVDISEDPMNGYTMAMLAFPSSPNEAQGTNGVLYDANWATVVSSSPTLIIQRLMPEAIPIWDADAGMWTGDGVLAPLENFMFAPELNVGGKYIYGASTGGWRPTIAATYRLTFFMRGMTNISLVNAVIGNYSGNTADQWGLPENKAAVAVVDPVNNLSYVDVTVVRKR
ncbi:MAG: hypothetical protein RBT50_10400 [Bacteroidales bacterium]|jgi:hypothetical protein|nr:hypothetical protein [Bacteroidales bacterium]